MSNELNIKNDEGPNVYSYEVVKKIRTKNEGQGCQVAIHIKLLIKSSF